MSDTKYHQALSANRKLVAEIERLKAENERLRSASFVTAVPSEQYERLRKAGDELERILTSKVASYEVGNASHEWQSAKKGSDAK